MNTFDVKDILSALLLLMSSGFCIIEIWIFSPAATATTIVTSDLGQSLLDYTTCNAGCICGEALTRVLFLQESHPCCTPRAIR